MASKANRKGIDIMVCEHSRGCDDFVLDFETLTKKQQKAIRRILAQEDDDE